MKATYALCHAAGWDAGNASAKAAGRTSWNEDDWNAAARTCNAILDTIPATGELKEDQGAGVKARAAKKT